MQRTSFLLAAAISLSLGACSSPSSGDHAAKSTAAPAPAGSTAAATTAKPNIGIDLSGIDHSVLPGNNFFRYANGDWLKTAKIPADRSSIGNFLTIYDRTQKRIADIVKKAVGSHPASGSDQAKIADFYTAYMNTSAVENNGLKPIQPALDAIAGIHSRKDLAKVLGSRLRQDEDPVNNTDFHTDHLFGLFVAQGLTDPSHNIAYLLQGGLTMPSRDYYLSSDKAMAATRDKYKSYIAALLKQAGTPNADVEAARVFDLEVKIAKAQESLVDSQDVHKADNLWSMADFARKAPGLDWSAYFKAAGLSDQKNIDVWQPSAFAGLSRLVATQPLADWRALLRFHTLDDAASLLPKAYANLAFDFHGKTLTGVPQQQPRAKRAVAATSSALGDAVGRIYVKDYFPPEAKKQVESLVHNIVGAFRSRLGKLSWMTPATRAKAKQKLDTMKVFVGYPDPGHWRSYAALKVSADNPLENAMAVSKFNYDFALSKLGKPVDRADWWMRPQTVNALNIPLENALNFPAAILQPPFFDPKADPAHNYGAIGAIIGHEISHSFDNMGSQFDAHGRLHNWWTKADAAHFKAATHKLVEQFNQYQALPGLHVNGQQTLGEDIADLSGLTVAYVAYHTSLDGKPAPVIDGLTGDQRFFLSFGQAWRSKMRDAALRQRVNTDVHAPPQFRAETVRNLDAWYTSFDVKPGQKLYLKPDQRVRIW
ncbi:M13 family metallopeptidase [Oleiagrimonas sp.]|jgi:putative endopeptidase|uniref:M13 family metallopeptidase n=1 Tax=Oleiagrimonas sp. TaxID=2010330 RepID=UPI00262F9E46|nr:M13 family metallopeptidase [Oleiagrimonas sp.]MDA3915043.1 M13 family metallopeptidase [Oleiagrimonas sp.]